MTYTVAVIDLMHPATLSHARNMFRDTGITSTSQRKALMAARELLSGHLVCEARITNEHGEPAGEVRRDLTTAEKQEYLRACWAVRRPGEAYPDWGI